MSRFAIVWAILCLAQLVPASAFAQVKRVAGGEPACTPLTCKVCVPEPAVVKTKTYEYECKPVDYCRKKCSGCCCCCLFRKCCDLGLQCGRVHTKFVLMKKVVTEEKKSFDCKVVERPISCAPPCPISVTTPIAEMPKLINQPTLGLPGPPPPTPQLMHPVQ